MPGNLSSCLPVLASGHPFPSHVVRPDPIGQHRRPLGPAPHRPFGLPSQPASSAQSCVVRPRSSSPILSSRVSYSSDTLDFAGLPLGYWVHPIQPQLLPPFLPHHLVHLHRPADFVERPSTPPRNLEGPRPPIEDLEDRYREDIITGVHRISIQEDSPPRIA